VDFSARVHLVPLVFPPPLLRTLLLLALRLGCRGSRGGGGGFFFPDLDSLLFFPDLTKLQHPSACRDLLLRGTSIHYFARFSKVAKAPLFLQVPLARCYLGLEIAMHFRLCLASVPRSGHRPPLCDASLAMGSKTLPLQ
jgi:hypothetical protein